MNYNPDAAALPESGIFGLPELGNEAAIQLIPVPWEVTTSYGGGASNGPRAILKASHQLDLFDRELGYAYEPGICLHPESDEIRALNRKLKMQAQKIIQAGGVPEDAAAETSPFRKSLAEINAGGEKLNSWVREQTSRILNSGKIAGILGGDHAVPFGAFEAAAEKFGDYGILHFDAHSDTRKAFEGFDWSHASIMHNALTRIPEIKKLTQVGIRDFCGEESKFIRSQGKRMSVFYDADLARRKLDGETWKSIVQEILSTLPEQVWVSFDIDGLDPRFCPHTGTPVPGGLDLQEAFYLLRELALSGRRILGFDLVEVAPHPEEEDEWDANVGMRLLYKLCGWTLASQGKIQPAS